MIRHEVMKPFSLEWFACISMVLLVISLVLVLPKYFQWARSKNYPVVIALLMLTNLLVENGYAISLGLWNMKQNLPLHLCGLSGIMGIMLMFRFNNALAQVFYYFGMTGSVHSLLTPEFDLGMQGYFYYGYFISHGGLLMICLYMIFHLGFEPEKGSWLKTFAIIQIMVLVIGIFDFVTGSNYMYLAEPPVVDNPLIMGKWPWYILVFEALALIHFFAFYKLYRVFK
jgi:hypothetical integral membrane protein (TIGR02206 family)